MCAYEYVCTCIHVCMYIRMHVYMHYVCMSDICMYVCMYVCMYAWMDKWMEGYMFLIMSECTMYVFMYGLSDRVSCLSYLFWQTITTSNSPRKSNERIYKQLSMRRKKYIHHQQHSSKTFPTLWASTWKTKHPPAVGEGRSLDWRPPRPPALRPHISRWRYTAGPHSWLTKGRKDLVQRCATGRPKHCKQDRQDSARCLWNIYRFFGSHSFFFYFLGPVCCGQYLMYLRIYTLLSL